MFASITCCILAAYTLLRYLQIRGLIEWLHIRNSLGILSVYPRGSGHYDELFSRISKSRDLKIMALSAESLVRFSADAMIEALIKNNCEIRILIAQETADIVSETEEMEGADRIGQIKTEIRHTTARLSEILRGAKEKSSPNSSIGRIWISRYKAALRGAMIICDNSWCWYTPNLPPKRAINSASFVLDRVPNGMLQDCLYHFDRVWNLYSAERSEIT